MNEDSLEDFNEETVLNEHKQINAVELKTFDDFNLNEILLNNIKQAQFEAPSPVQNMAIPKMLLGRDILCQAKSGTGKTAVFVLSTLENIMRNREMNRDKYKVVVLCNTVELATQIYEEYRRFSYNLNIKISLHNNYTENSEVIIGDLVGISKIEIDTINSLIIDESDQVIADTRYKNIYTRLKQINVNMNVAMFTATLTKKDKTEALKYLNDPFELYVDDDTQLTLYGLRQYYLETREIDKLNKVIKILKEVKYKKCIIFCNRIQNIHYIVDRLGDKYKINCISDKDTHNVTNKILNEFRSDNIRILCTTNRLSRGIDVSNVELVINYDLPLNPQTYLHRVGRAGRFETEGVAVNLINGIADRMRLKEIMERYEIDIRKYL